MFEGMTTVFTKISAISLLVFSFCSLNSAIACSPSKKAFENSPKLHEVLESHPIVFIGTVVDSGGPEFARPGASGDRLAKFRVEIIIRGQPAQVFEVKNPRSSGMCENQFHVGERWFFSGTKEGSDYFDGSSILVDQSGQLRLGSALAVSHESITAMFPNFLKLPPPSHLVDEYLKGKF
jgi:hypothetical protein